MAGLQEYKCPCCGGAVEFNSQVQKMKCPYCDTEFEMETLAALDEELKNQGSDDMKWETQAGGEWQEGETAGLNTYTCKSCGGEIIGDATMAATACPYCGNPVVMMGQFQGDLKPDKVIPFKLDKNAAKEGLKNHYKGKKLLPKVFKDENHIEEIKGVYVPFWLFDADADANIRYKATKVKKWDDPEFEYEETSYYSISRAGKIAFEHVPVDGSGKMADDLMESVEPFHYEDAVDFQTAYLAGYVADKYDVTSEQSITRANERIRKSTEEEFRKTVSGYDSVETEQSNIHLNNGTAKYALYPVWLLNTKWNNEMYTFAMNGQTGKVVGDLPMDKSAVTRWFLGVFAGSAVAVFLLMMLFGMETGSAVIGGLVGGLIIAAITVSSLKGQLKSVHMQRAAASYIKQGSMKVNRKKDVFMYKKLEKKEKPHDNDKR